MGNSSIQLSNAFDRFGTRFPALSDAYDRSLVKTALDTAADLGYKSFMQEGVYVAQVGPAFETPAECRFLNMVREHLHVLHYWINIAMCTGKVF